MSTTTQQLMTYSLNLTLLITSLIHVFGSYFFLRWLPGRPIFPLVISLFLVNLLLSWMIFGRGMVGVGVDKKKEEEEEEEDISKDQEEKKKLSDEIEIRGELRRRTGSTQPQVLEDEDEVIDDGDNTGIMIISPEKEIPTRNRILKYNMMIQVVMTLLALDFTFTSRFLHEHEGLVFSRITWINSTSAHIFSRIPNPGSTIRLEYKKMSSSVWNSISLGISSSEDSDFTSIVGINDLEPDTRYEYRFSSTVLEEEASDSKGQLIPKPVSGEETYSFMTSPVPFSSTKLYFGVGSCIKPGFPYVPFGNKGIRGIQALNRFHFDRFLFLGDFIYADTPFYFGPSVDSYRKSYRQIYSDRDVQLLAEKTPIFHAYDDHEILNNWDQKDSFPFGNAMTAFSEYQGSGPFLTSDKEGGSHESFYSMIHGDIGFFFWDTRRYRSGGYDTDNADKTMLGEAQKESFKKWIEETKDQLKVRFVISSVPLTYNWVISDAVQDTWKGYKHERQELLEFLAPIPNVFFLSGDRHEVSVVNLPFDKMEFSLSPINQFYGPLKFFEAQGLAPEFDPTILYYRHGNVKFGGFLVDTQSRTDGRPIIAVSIYSDMPGKISDNHFDPSVIASNTSEYYSEPKLPLSSTEAKIVSNFDFANEPALKDYLVMNVFSKKEPDSIVSPVMHFFWLGE